MKYIFKWFLLAPAAALYGIIIAVRNKCYDWGICAATDFPIPVITVGNITVGGTGKTPHTEKLVTLLRNERRTAVLSRGYKRTTKGFRYVSPDDTTQTAGDEPLQIKRKFPDIPVAVDRQRVNGIRQLMAGDGVELVILDDAFQHRAVRPAVSVLLMDYNRPVRTDCLLPLGRLRDSKSQIARADVVIITKCPPEMTPIAQRIVTRDLALFPYQSLFFTTFAYGEAVPVFMEDSDPAAVPSLPDAGACLLLTGIANPAPLAAYLTKTGRPPAVHLAFADHRSFTKRDVRRINDAALRHPRHPVFTTEKDALRLRETAGLSDDVRQRLYYLPVAVRFLPEDKEMLFKKELMKKMKERMHALRVMKG
ncbi:MAG: tetraacyldisaccharide 4'-kinase [Prevotellaceae bacterium]|jgi:tetraacyldisaccharide 4'-kinase|nr:tetraacyldisaccharide 4'-kinase [Prevotellaceae bacterium]